MGNPIQYCNTNNPSKMGGLPQQWGVVTTTYHCEIPLGSFTTGKQLWYAPPGCTTTVGLMKTLHLQKTHDFGQ